MRRIITSAFCLILTVSCTQSAETEAGKTDSSDSISDHTNKLESAHISNAEHCLTGPVAQFGQYIGDWNIKDWNLDQETGEWVAGDGAHWVFTCIGNGMAIQDFWRSGGGGYGTNIRTYNADAESWEIVWAASNQEGLMHISAKQRDNNKEIVMRVLSPEPSLPTRIIFSPPDDTGWDWILEVSDDSEQSWRGIYKIRASRGN